MLSCLPKKPTLIQFFGCPKKSIIDVFKAHTLLSFKDICAYTIYLII
jgi:hypothetical protein